MCSKPALHTGLTTFPEALGLMDASQLMPWTARKLGPRRIIQIALLGAAGFLAVAWGFSLMLRERDTAGVQYKKPAVPSAPKEKATVIV